MPKWQEKWRDYLPAFSVFITALILWESVVRIFDIQEFLLPAPSAIYQAFTTNFETLLLVGWFTTKEALGGLAIGCSAGILAAFATARWTVARETLMPFAIAANSVPILAFAPIFNNWFGPDNPLSKMMIVAVIVFFPMMINTTRGLTLVDPAFLELMRSYAASEMQILWKLRLPNAFPYIFSAFKVVATLSMIGAIVSEYFGGNQSALGIFIMQKAALFRFAESWAAILIACFVGFMFYIIVILVERFTIPWHPSIRQMK